MREIIKPFFLTFVLFGGLLVSCNAKSGKTEETTTPSTAPAETPAAAPSVADIDWKNTPGLYAVISTATGQIVCELEYQKAPITVANFVGLAEGTIPNTFRKPGQPYFDGLTFHRVEPGFVIQGGDPKGNGSGNPGYQFNNEISPDLKHNKPGTLAMANAGPNTNGSQFYITMAPTPSLDGSYSVFGYVVAGMNVVTGITKGEAMESVRIVRVGDACKAFDAPKTFAGKAVDAAKAQAEQMKNQQAQMAEFKKKYADHMAEVVKANAGYQAAWDKKVKSKFPKAKKTASGLYYIVDQQGTGPRVEQFKNAQVHYTGTLWDGKKFDSSRDRGQPFELMVGVAKVIPGWDEGLALFNQGGKGKLIIPYYLAYGDQAQGADIPAKSDLIFDVEIMAVQ